METNKIRLEEFKQKRMTCYEKNKPLLHDLWNLKGKGRNIRRNFLNYLRWNSDKDFSNEEEEYQTIGKFHRGWWSEYYINAFPIEYKDLLIEIAQEYGAFDY